MDNNGQSIFLAVDGDSAGQLVGRAVLADDVHALHEISNKINHGQDIIRDWATANGGMLISAGGDEGNLSVPQEALHAVEQLRADYFYAIGLTLTVGVGSSLSEAGKALMVGKLRGKNQTCQYDQQVEQEFLQAQQAANDGTATGEGKKLGEAYMKDNNMQQSEMHDCEYCKESADANIVDDDHCQYCHDVPALDGAAEPHCQYCAEAEQANSQHDVNAEGHDENCQYCAEAVQRDHEHSGDDCQYCQEAASGPAAPDHEHSGDDCQYCAEASQADAVFSQDDTPVGATPDQATNDQSMQQIAQEIEQTTQPGETPQDVLQGLEGPADMPGTQMQDNVSHPDNYEQNVPGDMGMAEEAPVAGPDLTQVLSGGLDNHADNIQREKVIQMVSEALQGFKGCKDILERAQQQAPQLYESSIAMLKAMIEMAKMLGLAPKEEAQPAPQEQPQQAAPAQAPQPAQPEANPAGKLVGR